MTYTLSLSKRGEEIMQRVIKEMPGFYEDATKKLALEVTGQIMDDSRVRTGRMRMGFSAVERRVGDGARRKTGRREEIEGRKKSKFRQSYGVGTYQISVENAVVYVVHVERKSPFIHQAIRKAVVHNRRELQDALHAFAGKL